MLVSEVPALREYWYAVSYAGDVGAEPMQATLFGEDYVLWRPGPGAAVHAAVDECPHRAARLSQGWVTDGCLVCPYHGWRYDGSGACVVIPSNEPDLPIPPRAHVQSVLVEERYGLVWLCIGMPRTGVPVLPELEDPAYTLIHEVMERWHASAPRITDNALDVSHVSFVHRGTVGDPSNPRLSDFQVEREGEHLRFSVTYKSRIAGLQKSNVGIAEDIATRTTHAELVQPFLFRGVLEYENGLKHVLFKIAAPIDDFNTLFCQFIARNDAPSPEKQADIVAVDKAVQEEDRRLLERINPNFPIQTATEIHTRSDRMTIEYRRVLADLAAETSSVHPDNTWTRRG
jgi:phenylpropionate dioxygenase-like ring-hydroxylating dioxygenase large terminal subunit